VKWLYIRKSGDAIGNSEILHSCTYLKERDLVFEFRVWRIRGAGHQREMIEQAIATQIRRRLRDYLAPLHGLAIPEGRSILAQVSDEIQSSWNIYLQ
jgi:hypothetical protein